MKRFLIGVAALLCGLLAWYGLHRHTADGEALPFARFPVAAVHPAEQLSTFVTPVAAQSDPAKLATLGKRQANPRLKRILYYLAEARATGADPGNVIDQAQRQNGSYGTPRAPSKNEPPAQPEDLRRAELAHPGGAGDAQTWRRAGR